LHWKGIFGKEDGGLREGVFPPEGVFALDYESSVSEAVRGILSEMQFIHYPLKEDLVNLSALARFLKPAVEKKLGETVSLDAIAIALKKAAGELKYSPPQAFEIVKNAKLTLRTGLSVLHFERSEESARKILDFQQRIDWAAGEKMYVLQRSEEMTVVVLSKYAVELAGLVGRNALLARKDNLALLTVSYPSAGLDVFGILEFLARQFTECGVSVIEVFSSFTKISFLFDEEKASLIYEKMSDAVESSEKLSLLASKKR